MCHIPAGKDATEVFEEIGHSNAAKDMLEKYIIGDYEVRSFLVTPFKVQKCQALVTMVPESAARQVRESAFCTT